MPNTVTPPLGKHFGGNNPRILPRRSGIDRLEVVRVTCRAVRGTLMRASASSSPAWNCQDSFRYS